MKKKVVFDMDGTIADLYGFKNWLPLLRKEDPQPYRECKPLFDMTVLEIICHALKGIGFHISVCTWGSIGSSEEYLKKTAAAKKDWLRKYHFPFDSFHCVPYGTPKNEVEEASNSDTIIIDDSKEVIENWEKAGGAAIVADENLINNLIKLIKREV